MAVKRKNRKPKITTIEGLAIAVQEGFSEMHERFDQVDKRFDRLEKRIEEAEKRIAALEMKVAGIYRMLEEEKMQRLDVTHLFTRLARLEQKVFGK